LTRKLAVILLSLTLILFLGACGQKNQAGENQGTTGGTTTGGATTGGTSGGTANAEAIFKQNCVACHGNNLEGKLGPNTNLQKVGAKLSKDQIVNQIKNGGNGMTPFKGVLSDDQINALADWLAAKK